MSDINELEIQLSRANDIICDLQYKISTLENKLEQTDKTLNDILYKISLSDILNVKTNQAYINNEYQHVLSNERLNKIEEHINSFNTIISKIENSDIDKKIEALKNILDQYIIDTNKKTEHIERYLDHIDDNVDASEIRIKDLLNENQMLFQGLVRLKQDFDEYVHLMLKERIFNAALTAVFSIELIANGVIDGSQYIQSLHNIVSQIIDAYKNEGVQLDFDASELVPLDSNIDSNGNFAFKIPTASMAIPKNNSKIPINKKKNTKKINNDMQQVFTASTSKKDNKNIINFNEILRKNKNLPRNAANNVQIKTQKVDNKDKEQLYNIFNDNFTQSIKENKIVRSKCKNTPIEEKKQVKVKTTRKKKTDNNDSNKEN